MVFEVEGNRNMVNAIEIHYFLCGMCHRTYSSLEEAEECTNHTGNMYSLNMREHYGKANPESTS